MTSPVSSDYCAICLNSTPKESNPFSKAHHGSGSFHPFHRNCLLRWSWEHLGQSAELRIANVVSDTLLVQLKNANFQEAALCQSCPLCRGPIVAIDNHSLAEWFFPLMRINHNFVDPPTARLFTSLFDQHIPTLQQSLTSQPPPKESTMEQLILIASQCDLLDSLNVLLSQTQGNRHFNPLYEATLFEKIRSGSENFPIINALLRSGHVSFECYAWAVVLTAFLGNVSLFIELIEQTYASDLRRDMRATLHIAYHVSIVRGHEMITNQIQRKVVAWGSPTGRPYDFSLSKEMRGEGVISATYRNFSDVLQVLLETGPVSPEDRGEALVHSANRDAPQCLQLLLESGPDRIPTHFVAKAIRKAAFYGKPSPLKKLLHYEPSACASALRIAAQKGHLHTTRTILRYGTVTEEALNQAIAAAERWPNLTTLLQNYRNTPVQAPPSKRPRHA